jgi:Ca2+/Na+ antiporter
MLEGQQINIQGFEIASDNPIFLSILAVHIAAGLTCVIAGLIAILSKKQKGRHSKSGSVYFWVICIVFITATMIAIMRWEEDYYLFLLGCVSFVMAFLGRQALRKRWNRWSVTHTITMSTSYIFLLIAFYVDNGRFLPVWKDIHPVLYWLLPILIGVPVIIRTLNKHPLTRHYFKRPG